MNTTANEPRGTTGASASRVTLAKLVTAAIVTCVLASLVGAANAGAAAWLPAEDISPTTGQSTTPPRVATDAQGNAVAVWLRSNGTHMIAQATQRTATGAWQPIVDLSAAGQNASEAQLAVDPAGNAVVLWLRSNGTHQIVQSSTRPAGGTWQAPVNLSAAGANAGMPRLAVDAQGGATAVWHRLDVSHTRLQAAIRPPGGSWAAATTLSAAGGNATSPAVAVNAQGTTVAAWLRHNGANLILQSSTRAPGGGWQAPVDLSAPGADAAAPQAAVDPNGGAVIVWARQQMVQSSVRAPGGAWQTPATLSIDCRLPPNPQVAVSPQGTVAVIWSCLIGSSPAVQTSWRPAGGAWESMTTLAPAGSAITPQVAFDPYGNAVAMWSLAVRAVVQFASRRAGGGWLAAADITANGLNASAPQLAIDSRGNAVGVWRRYDGTRFIVQSARYDGEGPLLNALSIPSTATAGQAVSFSVSPFDALFGHRPDGMGLRRRRHGRRHGGDARRTRLRAHSS